VREDRGADGQVAARAAADYAAARRQVDVPWLLKSEGTSHDVADGQAGAHDTPR